MSTSIVLEKKELKERLNIIKYCYKTKEHEKKSIVYKCIQWKRTKRII